MSNTYKYSDAELSKPIPFVSVGVAVYNGELDLPALLDSIINQSYQNLEIIICDNKSTDRTREVCDKFREKDSRVRYICNDINIGAVSNFNKVVAESTGQYFMWAAADDVFHPEYVASCLKEFELDHELVLVGSQTSQYHADIDSSLFIDKGVTLLESEPWHRFVKYREILLQRDHIGMIFYGLHRRDALEEALPLIECIGSDHLHISAMAFKGKIKTVEKVLAWKKFGGASRSYKEIIKTFNNGSRRHEPVPFSIRESEFQKQIKASSNNNLKIFKRSLYSLYHFIYHNVMLRSRIGQKMQKSRQLGLKNIILMFLYFVWYKRRPWSRGYYAYKNYFLEKSVNDPSLMSRFIEKAKLPSKFGFRIDERAVEYLWAFSRLKLEDNMLLDAGSALNFPFLLDSRGLQDCNITLCTLAPELPHYKDARVSYIYNDLRNLMLKDSWFDVVTCISTIEHVGMDNTLLYSEDDKHRESSKNDYLKVVGELKRVLKPGGKLLLTVPFGRYENYGWLQQFDADMIDEVIQTFDGLSAGLEFFRYTNDGWDRVEQSECENDSYYDFHSASGFTDDMLAAARSIACIELVK